jgi:hypothetical protein
LPQRLLLDWLSSQTGMMTAAAPASPHVRPSVTSVPGTRDAPPHARAAACRKSVKVTNYNCRIIANNAHHGPLPSFWAAKGERYAKQAYCTNPEAVRDIYERVANCESLLSIARSYDLYPASVQGGCKIGGL